MTERDLHTGPRGVRLRLCEWGEGARRPGAPPVLVLHGFLEQGAAWDDVAVRLGGRVVAPDHRGHGLSGHVGAGGWYHFWDYVRDVDAVADDLGGKVDLVGHSMGSMVSVLFAAIRPEKVRRLVLVEGLGAPEEPIGVTRATAFLDARATPPLHRAMAGLDEAVTRMKKFNPRLSDDAARRLAERTTRPVEPDDVLEGPPAGPGALVWTWDPLHRGRNPIGFQRSQYEPFARKVRAPTLLITGKDSWFVLPDQAERAGWFPNLRQTAIPGAGHLIHHDTPDALAAAILKHLEAA